LDISMLYIFWSTGNYKNKISCLFCLFVFDISGVLI
jgi:hypothetical protein